MRYYHIKDSTSLNINQSYEGESIEVKIEKIMSQKEQIKDTSPLIYTERSVGVQPGYDVRTDRFEIALEAMDVVSKSRFAKREERMKDAETKKKASSTEATE